MEKNERKERIDQGTIKTPASPNVVAAILDEKNSIQDVQNSESLRGDHFTEEMLNTKQKNDHIAIVMDDEEDIIEDENGDFLKLKDESRDEVARSMGLQKENSDDKTRNNSSLTKESLTKSVDSATLSSNDAKQKNTVNNKPQGKQKPKVNFIDQNKGNFSRKPGKSSYAALYSQKIKMKQSNINGKKGKTSDLKEENQSKTENILSEQYDKFNESISSSKPSSKSTNYNKSFYYNVDTSTFPDVTNYSMQSPNAQTHQSFNPQYEPQYDSYVNQPYHVPYRDFGLRYSNYGHQSYQTSSAMAYPQQSNVFNPQPVTQIQGYASQSAAPGVPHYERKPLIDQVEFFPEHNHFLSWSLTNSQFISPQQMYQRDSVLERKFMSEPQLSNSPQPLAGEKDGTSRISDDMKSHSNVAFKPYTLKDYRQIKNEQIDMLGSLGPDTESEGYKEKEIFQIFDTTSRTDLINSYLLPQRTSGTSLIFVKSTLIAESIFKAKDSTALHCCLCVEITKLNKQRQYAEIIRLEHTTKKKQWEKRAAPPPAPARQLQAEAKRQAAINYAKTVPKPKSMESRKTKRRSGDDGNNEEKEVTLLELLKMRHEKEKNEVQALKKEMNANTNN